MEKESNKNQTFLCLMLQNVSLRKVEHEGVSCARVNERKVMQSSELVEINSRTLLHFVNINLQIKFINHEINRGLFLRQVENFCTTTTSTESWSSH